MVARKMLATLLMAVISAVACPAGAEQVKVRLVYIVPRDRHAWPEFRDRADAWLKATQWYFACQMHAHGHGWRSFDYDKGPDGRAQVVALNSNAAMDSMLKSPEECLRLSGEAYKGFLTGLPAEKQKEWNKSVVILFRETLRMNPDGTFLWGATRGGGRFVYVSSAHLRFGVLRRFASEDPYEGKTLDEVVRAAEQGHGNSELLRQPLRAGAFPQHAGKTLGRVSSDAFGALVHEVGHAFGLPHTGDLPNIPEPQKSPDFKWAGWLMVSHGRIRGNFESGISGECAGLTTEEASVLAKGPFLRTVLSAKQVEASAATYASPEVGGRRPASGRDGNIVKDESGRPLIQAGRSAH